MAIQLQPSDAVGVLDRAMLAPCAAQKAAANTPLERRSGSQKGFVRKGRAKIQAREGKQEK